MVVALVVCLVPGTIWAHGLATKTPGTSARELQVEATRLTREVRATAAQLRATGTDGPRAKRLVALSNARREALEALVVDHPTQAAALILPQSTRRTLRAIPGAWAESHSTLHGRYRILETHDHGTSQFAQIVSEDGRTVFTIGGAKPTSGIRPNDPLEVTGYRFGNKVLATRDGIAVRGGPRSLTASATTTTVGPMKVAVIVGTFSDSSAVDVDAMRAAFQGSPGSDVVSFFDEASYGRMSVTPSFYGPYTLGSTSSTGCSTRPVQALIDAAAANVVYAEFSRLVFVFNCPGLSFGSATSTGPVSTPQGTVQAAQIALDARSAADRYSLVHELSHTLGNFNKHASFDICLPEAFIPPTRFDESCASGEYGDSFDVLGGPPTGSLAQLNPYHKANAGWFAAGEYPTVTTSGTFTLAPYEHPSASGLPLALNIPRGQTGTSFTVEYRQPLGFDTWMGSQGICRDCTVTSGASIRIVLGTAGPGGGSDTQLIDTTPGTIPSNSYYPVDDGRDGALLPGRTFTDPEYGITIETVSADASGLTVRVTVPAQTCVRGTPTASSATPTSQPGIYSVTLTNTDSAGCPPNTFRYLPYSSSSVTMVAQPDLMTLEAGASKTVSLTVSALPLTTAGSYTANGVFRSNTLGTSDANVGATFTPAFPADTSAPAAPSGLSATALGSTAVKLAWDPATDDVGVAGYRITRNGSLLTTGETSFVDSGLSAGTTYSYSVQAFDRRGNLSVAVAVTAVTPQKTDFMPPTPPIVSVAAGDHDLTVSWTKSSDNVGVAYYKIYPCFVAQCAVPATDRSLTVPGLPTMTRYDLQVVAVDSDGNTSSSALGSYPVYTAASGTTAPSQPKHLISPSGGFHRVELTWEPSSDDRGVARYLVYRNNRRIASVTSTSYTDVMVGAPAEYYVQAVDTDGSLSAPTSRASFPAAYSANADASSPSAAVTSPAAGASLSGTVELAAAAVDDVKVTNVQLYVDGVFLGYKTVAPYTYSWDTTTVSNGTHWLYARAFDAAGNYGTAGITTVTVSNGTSADEVPPSVSIVAPSSGGTVSGPVTIEASAADNVAVTKVVLAVDGSTVATDTSPPFTGSWDATTAAAGTHTVSATAYDAAGNNDRATATVMRPAPADTTPPTVTITAPANGATVTGTVSVTASASDGVGVTKVEFSLDGALVATSTSSPYGFSWNAAASAGSHAIAATAYDAAGNTATTQVSVSVAAAPTDTTVPKTPSNLKALVVGTTQVALSWVTSTDNVGVEAYEVYRDGVQVGESALPNFLDAGLAAGSSHKYTVRARDAAGNRSLFSSALSTRQVSLSTSTTGTVAGVVYNSLGRPYANVVVTLTGNGVTKTAKTGSSGTYKFSSLPPGSYTETTSQFGETSATVSRGVTLVLVVS
jgi:chitodextrinase